MRLITSRCLSVMLRCVCPQPQVEVLLGGGNHAIQFFNLMVSETNQLYDIGQGITFFLCRGTSYNRWIDYGIGVPKLFGRKMVFAILSLFSKSFNIE